MTNSLQIPVEFKKKVVAELLKVRSNFDGSDEKFSKQWSLHNAVFSRLKKGHTEGLIKDAKWVSLGRELNISLDERVWNIARTDVFIGIEEEVKFCKKYSKSKIFVDECGIGKTVAAKYLSRTLKNCFYIDASQAKTKQLFIRTLAKTLGVDDTGKYANVKSDLKYYIKMLPKPIIIVDEAGDLEYPAFLELKELWNATENSCGWYMIGADGLQEKINKGINSKKVGYREIFSRYSDKYSSLVPKEKDAKLLYYRKLITDVVSVNIQDKRNIPSIVRKCMVNEADGNIAGLRRAESLLILNS